MAQEGWPRAATWTTFGLAISLVVVSGLWWQSYSPDRPGGSAYYDCGSLGVRFGEEVTGEELTTRLERPSGGVHGNQRGLWKASWDRTRIADSCYEAGYWRATWSLCENVSWLIDESGSYRLLARDENGEWHQTTALDLWPLRSVLALHYVGEAVTSEDCLGGSVTDSQP